MVPYLSRKILGLAVLSLLCVWSLFEYPINLGLDLQGGTRIVYTIPVDESSLAPGETVGDVVGQTVGVFIERLTGGGMKDVPIYPSGDDQVIIEVPGSDPAEIDRIKDTIINQGRLEFRIVAEATDAEYRYNEEIEKFRTWRGANPDAPATDFNRVTEAEGGPHPALVWAGLTERSRSELAPFEDANGVPMRNQDVLQEGGAAGSVSSWTFTGDELGTVGPQPHPLSGELVVQFQFQSHRATPFQQFTAKYQGRKMAIVLNGEVDSAPVIKQPLPGGGIIEGGGRLGFSRTEVDQLVLILRTGSLRVKPVLDTQNTVSSMLGADSIRRGVWSALLGGALVFAFMLGYYRLNGVIACLGLLFNGFWLLGLMAFTQATLTLPGLAGLALTIGMAVDANILIFERVREERRRGREVPQAYKNGFERAFTTIIDSNLTTLITALILWKVGTGPVQGFAATLALGILTSMIAALVFSKVVFHLMIFGKGKSMIREVSMAQALAREANVRFLAGRRIALTISGSLIVLGLVVAAFEGPKMLGIDFVGGSQARVQLREATDIGVVRNALPAEYAVRTMGESAGGSSLMSDSYQITIKSTLATEAEGSMSLFIQQDLRQRLGDLLDPENPFPETNTVGGRVSGQIQQAAVQAILLSLIAIVIYMNFRFKEMRYGLAAVIALLHDVFFAIGALAICHALGWVTVDANLEILAAFLTIIGYSLNDTIVVFDRIRENLPRRSGSYMEVIDRSINETLSRTILTSGTTCLVLLILFVVNRPVHNMLEGFSFAMLIGIVVGTYSSIFVASPLLIYLDRWAKKKRVVAEPAA